MRRMGMRALGVAIALVAIFGDATAARAKPEPCAVARYVLQGSALLPGAPASQVDVVSIGASPPTAELSIGCTAAHLKGRVRARATRRGTKVAAQWRECAGLAKVRLRGIVTEACTRLDATFRADGLKTKPVATRSSCGDRFVDAERGEACEPAGAGCAGGGTCEADCTCTQATTTSTTSSDPTTTSTTLQCSPLAAPGTQGCGAGEKCTWIRIDETPEPIGKLGCAPDGVVAADGACTQGPAGETTGYDDCAAGLICVNSTCKDICGFDGSAGAACIPGDYCTRYANVFANGADDPVAGACHEGCNPLTQLTTSGDACPAGEGCYLLTSTTDTIAVCSHAGVLGHGATITGPAFANTCAPRHQPRLRQQGMSTYECGALCQPADVYMGSNESSEGGVAPYTCVAAGAPPPDHATDGETCTFWWTREPTDSVTAFSNTVGWCFRFAAFQYDSNGDAMVDTPYPRCISLTTGDVVAPLNGTSDALYFGCVGRPASLVAPLPSSPPALLDRVDGGR